MASRDGLVLDATLLVRMCREGSSDYMMRNLGSIRVRSTVGLLLMFASNVKALCVQWPQSMAASRAPPSCKRHSGRCIRIFAVVQDPHASYRSDLVMSRLTVGIRHCARMPLTAFLLVSSFLIGAV